MTRRWPASTARCKSIPNHVGGADQSRGAAFRPRPARRCGCELRSRAGGLAGEPAGALQSVQNAVRAQSLQRGARRAPSRRSRSSPRMWSRSTRAAWCSAGCVVTTKRSPHSSASSSLPRRTRMPWRSWRRVASRSAHGTKPRPSRAVSTTPWRQDPAIVGTAYPVAIVGQSRRDPGQHPTLCGTRDPGRPAAGSGAAGCPRRQDQSCLPVGGFPGASGRLSDGGTVRAARPKPLRDHRPLVRSRRQERAAVADRTILRSLP